VYGRIKKNTLEERREEGRRRGEVGTFTCTIKSKYFI